MVVMGGTAVVMVMVETESRGRCEGATPSITNRNNSVQMWDFKVWLRMISL